MSISGEHLVQLDIKVETYTLPGKVFLFTHDTTPLLDDYYIDPCVFINTELAYHSLGDLVQERYSSLGLLITHPYFSHA